MRSVVDESMANGYPPELRANAARFAAFRARWLGNDPASYAAIYRMLVGTDLQAELAHIACPVLVLGGALDRVRPPALAEPVARAIPGARYAVLQTGHYMAVETPELVAAAIGDFLDEVGA
jgi:3-oxoadipate enol-lactonase